MTASHCKMECTRPGLVDLWNASMVRGATFSERSDIPLCPSTASGIPKALIPFDEAKTIHKRHLRKGDIHYHIDAFIHFYIDDVKFDGKRSSIWLYPKKALEVIEHFAGIISPDFSTYADFPDSLKRWNFYRMNAFGYWIGKLGIPVISNVRWGGEETWEYCFSGNPQNSIIAIGTVASNLRNMSSRILFERGFYRMLETLQPHTIVVYGSSQNSCFKSLQNEGVRVVPFESRSSLAYHGRKHP